MLTLGEERREEACRALGRQELGCLCSVHHVHHICPPCLFLRMPWHVLGMPVHQLSISPHLRASFQPSVSLSIRLRILSPGFDFRLNLRPVRRVRASGSMEAPGWGEGGARPGFIPGRVPCSGVRSSPGGAARMEGWMGGSTD